MSHVIKILAIAAIACASAAQAQFVKGNEAVRLLDDGKKVVETPPLPKTASSRMSPCKADGGCHVGPWRMVETAGGLLECTEVYARPTTCRASSYGTEKRSRLWVVKVGGSWRASACRSSLPRPPICRTTPCSRSAQCLPGSDQSWTSFCTATS
jgi:hypothetical protein